MISNLPRSVKFKWDFLTKPKTSKTYQKATKLSSKTNAISRSNLQLTNSIRIFTVNRLQNSYRGKPSNRRTIPILGNLKLLRRKSLVKKLMTYEQ